MPNPELYAWYTAEEAISFFGSPDEAHRFCNGQWLIFPITAICLTNIGEGPSASRFDSGTSFCWVADQPYRVNEDRWSYFVPAQVLGSNREQRSIRLFVRPSHALEYLYAGELACSHRQEAPGTSNHGAAHFELKPTLPSAVWLRLGGLRLGDLDVASVDAALDLLRRPTTVHDRLGVLHRLVNFWHRPIKPEDGMSDADLAGVPLPLPLRWWYRWAGRRSEVMSGQNILLTPRQLAVTDGRLCFYAENQYVYQWSTLPEGDDPPVFGRYDSTEPWRPEDMTLSEHLILACLSEAVICRAKYGATAACLDEETFAAIVTTLPPLAIAPWRWLGTRFFAARGAFMCAAENGESDGKKGYSVWIGAKTEHPLQFLRPYLDRGWEYAAV